VRVVDETSGELRDRIAAGVLDLAITNFDEPIRDVIAEPLGREPMMLVGPPGSPLFAQSTINIADLATLPLVLTTRPNSLRLSVESSLARLGLRPNIRIEANTLPLMTDLVTGRLGYTVLPFCGVRNLVQGRKLAAAPIADFDITWLLAKPKARSLSAPAEAFCTLLRELAQEQIELGVWADPVRPRPPPKSRRSTLPSPT